MQFSQKSSIDISDSTHPLTDDSLPDADYLTPDITSKYFVHFLSKTDTIAGIALFYHVNIPLLKRVNKLSNEIMLFTRKYVLIPKVPQNIHLEASIGTVIYPNPPEPPPIALPITNKPQLTRTMSVEPRIENHGWNHINTQPQFESQSAHSDSYLHRIESAVLNWYTQPSNKKSE
eukprot:NODE_87_length_21893_cov_0.496559.p14 type:complete len:175 gc:universal NODE_87_length_21893_cov_0.496559:3881-3357(-)